MDKQTLNHYGWIVVVVMILSILISMVTPFGDTIKKGYFTSLENNKTAGEKVIEQNFNEFQTDITEARLPGLYNSKDKLIVSWENLKKRYPDALNTREDENKDSVIHSYDDVTSHFLYDRYEAPLTYVLGDKLVLPNSIEYFESAAFADCVDLKEVVFNDKITYISTSCFKNCVSLNNVNFRKGINAIYSYAFENCVSLTDIYINSNITYIGDHAFNGCNNLETVVIDNGVEVLNDYTFNNCEKLSSLTIPNSINKIGSFVFTGCDSLKEIKFYGTMKEFKNIDFCDKSFDSNHVYNIICEDGILFIEDSSIITGDAGLYSSSNSKLLVTSWNKLCSNGDIEMSSGTNSNDTIVKVSNELEGCLVIPQSVKNINNHAFASSKGLTSVFVPSSVTTIEGYAFYDCKALTTVTINAQITDLSDNIFMDCKQLSNVYLPEITTIGNSAFSGCSSLQSIYIPDSVTTIRSGAFSNCGLNSVYIPDSVTFIGDSAFSSSLITNVRLPENNFYHTIGNSTFSGCYMLENITIPNNISIINAYAFQDCTGLKDISFGNYTMSLGEYSFSGCRNLANIYYPKTLQSFNAHFSYSETAFENCNIYQTTINCSDGQISIYL